MPEVAAQSETTQEKRRGEHLAQYRFQPGNPGRPKGARNKLGEAFLEGMLADFQKHGPEVIEKVRGEKPDQYLKVVASILPKELEAGERLGGILEDILERIDGRTRTIDVPVFEITG